jgi:hypothetical protein
LRAAFFIAGHLGRQNLESHIAGELGIVGKVDLPHAVDSRGMGAEFR